MWGAAFSSRISKDLCCSSNRGDHLVRKIVSIGSAAAGWVTMAASFGCMSDQSMRLANGYCVSLNRRSQPLNWASNYWVMVTGA